MVQLCFNNNFNEIIDEYPKIAKKFEEIPQEVKDYIKEVSRSRYILDINTNKKYCSNCSTELNKNNTCNLCNRTYKIDVSDKYIIKIEDIKKISDLVYCAQYYFFDFYYNNPILYRISECIYPKSLNYITNRRKYEIENVFFIKENEMIDLYVNKTMTYKEIEDELDCWYEEDFLDDNMTSTEDYGHIPSFIYLDNLEKLKNTIYKYTNIWESKDYLKDNYFSYEHLTYFPIATKYFEYLMKAKLYKFAYSRPDKIIYDRFFKDNMNYILDNALSISEIDAFRLVKLKDLELIKAIKNDVGSFRYIEEDFNLKTLKVKAYFDKNNLNYNYLNEYIDYLQMAYRLGFDMKDKRILFPENLMEEHDNLYTQMIIKEDPEINNNIKRVSKLLSLNKYEDDKYIIYPASSVENLIDESKQQHNCVRTYCERYSKNETQIYLMREKGHKEQSLVTIEVNKNRVIQARIKYNAMPSNDLMKVINNWERRLVQIVNE